LRSAGCIKPRKCARSGHRCQVCPENATCCICAIIVGHLYLRQMRNVGAISRPTGAVLSRPSGARRRCHQAREAIAMPELEKVALFTNEYPPNVSGGAGVHVEYLSRELARLLPVEVRCFGAQELDEPNLRVRGYGPWYEAKENTDPRF